MDVLKQSSFLQENCEVISGLFNVVITIVDKNFIRIAGTDHYKENIGKVAVNPNVFKKIMEEEKTIIINDPGNELICRECKNIANCSEKAAIYTPLRVNNVIVGGVGIIAFTEEQKRSGIFYDKNFFKFTQKLSELLSGKIEAQEYARELKVNLKKNIAILDSVHDGVIAIDENKIIYQINNSASVNFGIKKELFLGKNIKEILSTQIADKISTDKSFLDIEDTIKVGESKNNVFITAQTIEEENNLYGTVLIIKSMKDANSIVRKLIHGTNYEVSFEDIIGKSKEISHIKALSQKIAGSDSTILIRGESGTGKEMFARAIHHDSNRKNGPFIAINCAAIPEPLLESELFGYDDGAFTGAKRGGKIGKCELAVGGTLFLDEVGDIPIFLQSKFLRMLQERTIERVGGNKTIPVDIRIIAATNRDLEKMIKNNEYREDLYYRLNVIPIFLPSLRERKDDIVIVSNYFLLKYVEKLGKNIESISKESMDILCAYNWPGNLRELENAIECAVNMETSSILKAESLPEKLKKESCIMSIENISESRIDKEETLKSSIKHKEHDEIIKALDKYGWDTKGKKNAAKSLGIGIATLYRILNK